VTITRILPLHPSSRGKTISQPAFNVAPALLNTAEVFQLQLLARLTCYYRRPTGSHVHILNRATPAHNLLRAHTRSSSVQTCCFARAPGTQLRAREGLEADVLSNRIMTPNVLPFLLTEADALIVARRLLPPGQENPRLLHDLQALCIAVCDEINTHQERGKLGRARGVCEETHLAHAA
jgi:hypothetical protein